MGGEDINEEDWSLEDSCCGISENCGYLDECGGERQGPSRLGVCCGYTLDRRPFLPIVLLCSTIAGAWCMLIDQIPAIYKATSTRWSLYCPFAVLYITTITLGIYCSLCDPGMVKEENDVPGTQEDDDANSIRDKPPRSHKSWMYQRPVRRYDHYCRWLMNVIGLTLLGIGGVLVDAIMLFIIQRPFEEDAFGHWHWCGDAFVVAHFLYSAILTAVVAPILQVQLGLVTRNELACEWKHNDFYVIHKEGAKTPVAELTDEEYNDRFDSFIYDDTRNKFDKGAKKNWQMFLCSPRWCGENLKGDF